ncbi:MAG TPA: ATP-binding protein [Chthoniobacterales bacterium]|nr:ATP-binding protein [Chthoniobacterales bacterium]
MKSRLASVCLVTSIIPVLTGTLVLLGWTFGIETFKRVGAGFVAMNPATAISLVAAGTALLILRDAPGLTTKRRWHGRLIAGVVVMIALTKLVSLATGSALSLDQWLFRSELVEHATRNRMAPNTALALLLCGLALLLSDVEIRRHRPAEMLTIVGGAIGFFALIGYLYRSPNFYGMANAIPMAVHTAIAIIALAAGLLLARADRGLMSVVTSDTAGGIIARRLLPVAIFLPIALDILRLIGEAHGLYEVPFGTALSSTAMVLIFLSALWWMARVLFNVDTERRYIARWQNEKLERTVEERTRRLQQALRQLRETQQQVLQQERLHALGTMASGVTHDFNNALSVIIGFGEMALQECNKAGDGSSVERYVRPMVVAALDGAKLVTRLREFYRPGGHEEPKTAVDLNTLVDQAIAITEPKWKAQRLADGVRVEIKAELATVPPAAGDASELREALANLIFNAVDAMPNGGAITIRTFAGDDRVLLSVSDTGVGMSKDVQRRCLDPFFTTKGEHGTGLGLAMVYGIMERHRGSLGIESEEGKGTTFVLSLPIQHQSTKAAEVSAPPVASPLNVLIADDQPILCEILAEYLKNDCHTVTAANDGREALGKFDQEKFDVVITDQAMPEMNGQQLARAIKQRSPSTPVILLTGFGEATGDATQVIDEVLSKPVSQIDLRHALMRATEKTGLKPEPIC